VGSQAIPEYRKHARGVGTGTGAHGEEQARQQGRQVGAADVGADDADPLSPAEKKGDVCVQVSSLTSMSGD
jgi:hypothetical protein